MIRVNNVKSGTIAVQVRVNGRTPSPLRGYEGTPTANSKTLSVNTLTVSGMVHLNRFDKVRVYLWVQSGTNWNLDAESGLSIVFMGRQDVLGSDVRQLGSRKRMVCFIFRWIGADPLSFDWCFNAAKSGWGISPSNGFFQLQLHGNWGWCCWLPVVLQQQGTQVAGREEK